MTPDDHDADRTVIRPPSPPPAPPTMAADKTQRAGPPAPSSVPPSASQADHGNGLPAGTFLGEFELGAVLGEGGFGIVYLATDHSLQRRVAVKEYMPAALAARTAQSQVRVLSERHRETFEAGRKSFINEARLLAQFDHPSLVKVYRFWEANGTAYMVMPFYEGQTLRDTLRERLRAGGQAPDEDWLRTLLLPLTEALVVIHTEQCYHRDIAPDNVMMLAGSQRPLLLDFGAARRVIGDMTQALTVILKPGYAPVEQYAEIPGMKQGPWTDVYALAAVVYFAIIGKTPPPSVGRLLNDTYVPLVQAAAGRYSPRFLAAIDRALLVRPEQRTQSVGELRSELGLGEVSFDPYQTRPLTQGQDAPPAAPAAARPQASAGAAAAAPAAARKAGGRMVGMGAGVLLLGALGVAAYSWLAPAARPQPPVVADSAPAPVVTALAPASAAAVLPVPLPAPVPAPPAVFDISREFERIVQAATPGFELRTQVNKTVLRIERDELSFTLQSEREGFVYVFLYGADKVLMQLYPNIESGTLKIRKGQTLKLPQSPVVLGVTEPAGPGELLVLVSARQRDHAELRSSKDGAFRVFATDAASAEQAARHSGPVPLLAGRAICPGAAQCADEFGATEIKVEVVR